jgi:hypothetical protein
LFNSLTAKIIKGLLETLSKPTSIAPLITFRIGFGLLMLFSTIRYLYLGWVDAQLVDPLIHFSYYGFDWVKPLPGAAMHIVFYTMILSSLGICLGLFYRYSTVLFFLCFSYVELIDISFYLNHYYFVSIISFLLIWVPADRNYSLDVLRRPGIRRESVSRWCIDIFKLQIAIVYIYAGLAKINYDWLIRAMPLAIWLPAKSDMPLIGWMFKYKITAYLFSWVGMLFDTFIVLFLNLRKTRWLAYFAVILFYSLTGALFQIGVFPVVMIVAVNIFFPAKYHEQFLKRLGKLFGRKNRVSPGSSHCPDSKLLLYGMIVFFCFQILFPWRYLLYNGNLFWTEEGYRFSWRVMLMEKAGTATFYVKDGPDGREGSVINRQFLGPHQEKQMAMQPDLILQFAHFLDEHYQKRGMKDPQVRAEVMVTLNGSPAQLLVDPTIDLSKVEDNWERKEWILPFKQMEAK